MRAILTYHSLDESGSPISLSPDAFRAHCEWLSRGEVSVVSLEDLLETPASTDAVALTFDDAFANFYEVALPILRDHAWPATVFVVTGHVGGNNAWGGEESAGIPTLPLMDWKQLEEVAAGGIQLAPHTVHHPALTDVDDQLLDRELTESKEKLRDAVGASDTAFAYPYGAVNERVRHATARVFPLAVTTEFDVLGASPDPLLLPRLDAFYFKDATMLAAWGSPRFRRFVRWRGRLRALKRTLTRAT